MKKVALSLIALLAVGGFASAEDVAAEKAAAVAVSLSASATAKFGIDLDHTTTGFAQGEDFDLNFDIVPDKASNKEGAGDVHASIAVGDVEVYYHTDDAAWTVSIGDITAKIVFPNGYLQFHENQDASAGYAADGDDDNGGATIVADDTFYTYSGTYGATDTEWTAGTIGTFSGRAGNGVAFHYELPKLVGVTATVDSYHTDWTDNKNNGYKAGGEVSFLAVDKLTLKANALYGSGDGYQAAGASLGYDLGIAAPYANVSALADAGNGTNSTDGSYAADFGTTLKPVDGFAANIAATYNSAGTIDAVVTAKVAADKLIGPVGLFLGYKTTDVTGDAASDIFAQVNLSVTKDLGVWAKASYNTPAGGDASLFAKAGADLALFALTTVGCEWDSNDLGAAKAQGDNTLGQAYAYLKVAY